MNHGSRIATTGSESCVFHVEIVTHDCVVEQISLQSDCRGARIAAVALAQQFISACRKKGQLNLDWCVVLKDADFATLETIPFWQVINGQ